VIDRAKRNTLKVLSVATGSALAAGNVVAAGIRGLSAEGAHGDSHDAPLANIRVSTRVSAVHNDISVVLTNAGDTPTTITQITPAVTRVARGEFNFSTLLENGPVMLKAGESVVVPLTHETITQWPSTIDTATPSLAAKLRSSMSIVTDDTAFAQVDVSGLSAFA
jgi:hypothetical protein